MNIIEMINSDFTVSKIICMAQTWKNLATWSYLHTKRPDHGFYAVLCGRCEYMMKSGETLTACQGDIMYIPKGINYEVRFYTNGSQSNTASNAYLINFCLKDEKGEEAVFCDGIKKVYRDDTGELSEDFSKILNLYRKNRVNEVKSIFYRIISKITEDYNNINEGAVSPAIQYIQNNFNSQISIGTLADLCAMSQATFRRLFKETTGKSPVKYINSFKIEKSKELLKSSEITIDDITDFLSFYDKAYFCKVFKNAVGVSPSEYRRHFR